MDNFATLAGRFRQAAEADDKSPAFAAVIRDAKRAAQHAIDAGRLDLAEPNPTGEKRAPQFQRFETGTEGLPHWKTTEALAARQKLDWKSIVGILCERHPCELPLMPDEMRLIAQSEAGQVLVEDPRDWRLRARNYAEVCDWLAKRLDGKEPPEELTKPSKEATAIALLKDHPEWTNKEIADNVPCHEKSLYRFKSFVAAREMLERGRDKYKRTQNSDDLDE